MPEIMHTKMHTEKLKRCKHRASDVLGMGSSPTAGTILINPVFTAKDKQSRMNAGFFNGKSFHSTEYFTIQKVINSV